ncbi:GNAT family N-acetyltransferase [Streptomyces longispororuber]|uniref:GNAT family N-acetyltransferase n=1 Tax=Streptomyces longispororuber TaxID=68230 RepID=UPI0036FA5C03
MPYMISNVVEPGALADRPQPTMPAPGGLTLRPWTPKDAPSVYEAFKDPVIQRWHARAADSEDEVRSWMETWRTEYADETSAQWAVADADTDEVLGRVALRMITLADGQAEMAYWTMPRARGRGVASRAVTALTAWAFDDLGLHRLELRHSTRNEPSCRVALRTGYTPEGTQRSAALHEDGWHDMHLHARIRPA